ncbi:MAG: abortive infection family protein [Ignavibacteriales bacterium]|nr:abortive infection family protein [Ignavibacteriales bacterium]
MITLYSGSGAQDSEILNKKFNDEQYSSIKSSVERLLEARGHTDAVYTLRELPFQLSEGTNGFGDEFLVLHCNVSVDEYAKSTATKIDPTKQYQYELIAQTFTEIGCYVRFIGLVLVTNATVGVVSSPTPQITTSTVERALKDAQNLLQTSGPASAVDRVHTALHGYLKKICDEQPISYGIDPSIGDLFSAIRDHHPKFIPTGPHDPDILKILRGCSKIIDAVNILRNRASVAHPNPVLLEEPEAILVINTVRTLLHYVDSKIQT